MSFQPLNPIQFGAPALPVVYCNGVQVAVSQWDITCLFFHATPLPASVEQTGSPADGTMERRIVQAVVMSPQHAKALAVVLTHNVEAWEQQNGEISLPADMARDIGPAKDTSAQGDEQGEG